MMYVIFMVITYVIITGIMYVVIMVIMHVVIMVIIHVVIICIFIVYIFLNKCNRNCCLCTAILHNYDWFTEQISRC